VKVDGWGRSTSLSSSPKGSEKPFFDDGLLFLVGVGLGEGSPGRLKAEE
jgi:hypothetical protein